MFFSCISPEKEKEQLIWKLRKLNYDYFFVRNKPFEAKNYRDSIRQVYANNKFKQELYFLNDFLYQYSYNYDDNELVFQKIDSVIKTPEFKNTIPVNRFYVYYSASKNLAEMSLSDEAFDYGTLALEELERESEQYPNERALMKDLILQSLGKYLDIKDLELAGLVKSYNKSKESKNINDILRDSYNLAFYYYAHEKNYTEAIKWINITLETQPDLNQNPYFRELEGIKGQSYKYLGKNKEVKRIYEEVYKKFQNGQLTKEYWIDFQTFYVDVLMDVESNEKIINHINTLVEYYGYNCEKRYELLQLLPPLSKLYQNIGNREKELETLQNTLTYVTGCNDFDEAYLEEEERVLERMFVIQIELGNHKESEKILAKIKSRELQSEKNNEVFVKLDNYFSKNQMKHLGNLENLEKTKEINSERQKMAYILIAIILLLTIVFVRSLIVKNKKVQEDLKDKNEELNENNQRIDLQNQEMSVLIKTLEESNANLQKFAKMAAEDIRSPIRQITQDIEEISKKYRDVLEEDDQEILDFLKESTQQLIEMIETLLQYARNDQDIVDDEYVNLELIIENVKNNLLDDIIDKNVTINYPENIPIVYANRAMIGQLFQNLISNAIKFRKPNEPLVIDVSYEQINPDTLQIAVKDNGVGIKEEDQSEIFKVFKKVESVEDYQGSGIGLSTCKKVVEKFGGNLWVESEWGKGSTFYFTLPTKKPSKNMKEDTMVENV